LHVKGKIRRKKETFKNEQNNTITFVTKSEKQKFSDKRTEV
jgi:hypothetical protein